MDSINKTVHENDTPLAWYFYTLILVWLAVLTIQMAHLPAKLKVSSGAKSTEYQAVGVVRPLKNDPYIVVPIYVATKDMRSWHLMRHADKLINEYKDKIQLSKGD